MYNKLLKTTLRLALMSAIFAASVLPQTVTAQDDPAQDEGTAKTVYYVKPDAEGLKDGSSWKNASDDLQAIINEAKEGDEVWVWKGTYIPTTKAVATGTDLDVAFVLRAGVNVYGGFNSEEETESVPKFGEAGREGTSTLSGDLDKSGSWSDKDAYHVVIAAGISADSKTILDGFTISGGNANGSGNISVNGKSIPRNVGGGIICRESSPILTNLIISGNKATTFGGGIYNNTSSPTLTDVTISKNEATSNGGGIYNITSSSPKLENVTINGNNAANGGGIFNTGSSPTLTDVTINKNGATNGGGIYNTSSSSPELKRVTINENEAANGGGIFNTGTLTPKLDSVTISGNTVTASGGGIYNNGSSPELKSVIISGNAAANGGGIFNTGTVTSKLENVTISGNKATTRGGGINNAAAGSSPELTKTIVWGNSELNVYSNGSAKPTYKSSMVAGVTEAGEGDDANYAGNTDPQFVSPISAENAPTTTGDYHLMDNSPFVGISLGAYENKYEITLSGVEEEDGHDFGSVTFGYEAQTSLPVTVENTGEVYILGLSIELGGNNPTGFDITDNEGESISSIENIQYDNSKKFYVVPKTGLDVGRYAATVTVSKSKSGDETGDDSSDAVTVTETDESSKSFSVSFLVTKATPKADDLIYAPKEIDYNGKPQSVKITEHSTGLGGITIKYNGSTDAPKAAGTYEITVDIDGEGKNFNEVTNLSLGNFVIRPIKPETTDLAYDLGAVAYNGEPRPVAVTSAEGIEGLGAITVMYDGSTTVPTNAGTYKITVDIATGSNYTNNRQSVMSLGNYTINRIAPTRADIVYDLHSVVGNGSPQSVTVKAAEGIVGLGAIQVLYKGSNEGDKATENKPIDPGVYTVSVTIAADKNYNATTGDPWVLGEFIIYKPQTIQHRVTILPSSGLETFPSFGSYNIAAGANFSFRIKLNAPLVTGTILQVQTNRTGTDGLADFLITPDADGLNYTVVIFAVNQNIEITLDTPTGNASVAADALTLGTVPGALVVTNSRSDAVTLQVYTPAGTPVRLTTVPPGTTRLTVPPGIYIVTDGGAFRRKTAVVQ
jgi:predicted outer membrane repeat protein